MIKLSLSFRKKALMTLAIVSVIVGFGYAVANRAKQPATEQKAETVAIPVKAQKAFERFESVELVTYPGVIESENEATIIAKANGTASNVTVNVGGRVEIGQELVKIDDVTSNGIVSSQPGFNANQIKQAEVVVQQALTSLQLARNNQATVLQTSNRDLRQAEISADQSATAQQNLQKTTEESLKAAESGYVTAKIATEQARLSLENRKKISDQSSIDVKTNADSTMTSSVDACASVISSINVVTGVEVSTGGVVAYRDRLGTLDSGSSERSHQSYLIANEALKAYRSATYSDQASRLNAISDLVKKTKTLTDEVKHMLEKTVASTVLPQTTLSTIQGQVIGYQTQMNTIQAQLNQVSQALTNTDLNNDSTLDTLQKAYEIAQQQEQTAAQNVANLKAGNTSQSDQIGFSVQSAQNQLEATKSRIDGQVLSSKSQVELAQMQYENAVIALQNLSDAHRAIAPIAGVVIKKNVSNGDTISQGQVLATIGTPDQLKTSFFIDQDSLSMVSLGLEVRIGLPNGVSTSGTIVGISPQADAATHRYEIEVRPILESGVQFPLGSIVDITVPLRKIAGQGNILVPLSSIDVTSNGTFLTIVKDEKAERIQVEMKRVLGEIVEIRGEITPETLVIIDGNRMVTQGSLVSLIQ